MLLSLVVINEKWLDCSMILLSSRIFCTSPAFFTVFWIDEQHCDENSAVHPAKHLRRESFFHCWRILTVDIIVDGAYIYKPQNTSPDGKVNQIFIFRIVKNTTYLRLEKNMVLIITNSVQNFRWFQIGRRFFKNANTCTNLLCHLGSGIFEFLSDQICKSKTKSKPIYKVLEGN